MKLMDKYKKLLDEMDYEHKREVIDSSFIIVDLLFSGGVVTGIMSFIYSEIMFYKQDSGVAMYIFLWFVTVIEMTVAIRTWRMIRKWLNELDS